MNETIASAPGKLFLLGEYAVLAGGPALLTTTQDRQVMIRRRALCDGYRVIGASFDDPRILPGIAARLLRLSGEPPPRFDDLTVDLRPFYTPEGEKLGLGSSAASSVALIAALAPSLDLRARLELALRVHREFQGGGGSGADVAASALGGTIGYGLNEAIPEFLGLLPRTSPLSPGNGYGYGTQQGLKIPAGVRLHAVWTGSPARTTSFTKRLVATLGTDAGGVAEIFQAIAAIAEDGLLACVQNDCAGFLSSLDKGDAAMEALGDLAGLSIITETHRRLRAIAHKDGFVVKPSGAGGGDFTLVAGPVDLDLPESIRKRAVVLDLNRPRQTGIDRLLP